MFALWSIFVSCEFEVCANSGGISFCKSICKPQRTVTFMADYWHAKFFAGDYYRKPYIAAFRKNHRRVFGFVNFFCLFL